MQSYYGTKKPNVFTADLDGPGAVAYGRGNYDVLNGSNAGDALFGGRGADTLHGNDGNDFLLGGVGRDYLYGGNGDDTLAGGRGKDYFVFNLDNDGVDVVTDFNPQKDTLSFLVGDPNDIPDLSYDAATGYVYNAGQPVVWIGHHEDFDI